jgi:hypothetical protein
MALVHLRTGEYDKAIGRPPQSLSLKINVAPALCWSVLAIAELRLGHADAARKWFAQADR